MEDLNIKMINPQKLTTAQQAKFERETIINWNELEDEAVYISASPKEWLKMEKLGIKPFKQNEYERCYRVPKAWIKVKKPGKRRGKSINEIVGTSMLEFQTL